MGKNKDKQKLTGPWRNIHAALWLIGIAVIALKGWWWPGILVLAAASALLEAAIMKFAPDAVEVIKETAASEPLPASNSNPIPAPAAPVHHAELLPTNCPKCGAPTRGHEVKWTGERSADCPFCGANLPMKT